MLSELLKDIYRARHHIHLEFYIFEDDAVGRLVRDALIDRARDGVKIRVLYDDVGCWKVPHDFYEQMLCEGIEVLSFLKVRFPRFTSKVNYRNHRKIVVIDGCVGFIGGMNLAERYVKGLGKEIGEIHTSDWEERWCTGCRRLFLLTGMPLIAPCSLQQNISLRFR